MIIISAPGTPKEVFTSVSKYIKKYGRVVERVVDTITVEFGLDPTEPNGSADDFEAAIMVQEEYRTARLRVSTAYLRLDEGNREITIAHELAHIITAPLRGEMLRIIANFTPKELKDYIHGVCYEAEEKVVHDMSRFLVENAK